MKIENARPQSRAEQNGEESGNLWEFCLFAILFVMIFSAIARADVSSDEMANSSAEIVLDPAPKAYPAAQGAAQSEITATIKKPVKPVAFKARVTAEKLASLYNYQDGSDTARTEYGLAPSVNFKETFAISGLVEVVQDEKAEKTDFGRGLISGSYVRGAKLGAVKFTPSATVGFPISDDAKLASVQLVTYVSGKFDIDPASLFSEKLNIGGGVSIGQYFHQYDTAKDGSVNTKNYSLQSLTSSWDFTSWLTLALEIVHYDAFSYQGNHVDYIGHRQEISLNVSKNLTFGFGHQYGDPYASTLKSNGQDFNLKAQDETSSLIFGNVTVTL